MPRASFGRTDLSLLSAAILLPAFVIFAAGDSAQAHHTYAMFDASKTREVSGTVAKLEWKNPHVFLWVYVPKPSVPGKYDLWAFENGSPAGLSARGWTRQALKPGERVTIEYWPLKSGANGGHFERAVWPDGRVLVGAGGPGRF